MNYSEAKNILMEVFQENNLMDLARDDRYHSNEYLAATLSNGTQIIIVYPGYKCKPNRYGGYTYDYRVDIVFPRKDDFRITLSHVNLIVDIYNKCANNNDLLEIFDVDFRNVYTNGTNNLNLTHYENLNIPDISSEFIDSIKNIHRGIIYNGRPKQYNHEGNRYSLTFEELFESILWISLQEDINYPMPRYEGRRMPISRYLETLWTFQDNDHNLDEVIKRTLSHSRPTLWDSFQYPDRLNSP